MEDTLPNINFEGWVRVNWANGRGKWLPDKEEIMNKDTET